MALIRGVRAIPVLIAVGGLLSGCYLILPKYDTSTPKQLTTTKEIGIFVGVTEMCMFSTRNLKDRQVIKHFDKKHRGNISYDLGRETFLNQSFSDIKSEMKNCAFYKESLQHAYLKDIGG